MFRTQLFAFVQFVPRATCLLLRPGGEGEVALHGVLRQPQALQAPHRVVAAQPAELHVAAVVAPWQGAEPWSVQEGGHWTGLGNATLRRPRELVRMVPSPGMSPGNTQRGVSLVTAASTRHEMTCEHSVPSTENRFSAKHRPGRRDLSHYLNIYW